MSSVGTRRERGQLQARCPPRGMCRRGVDLVLRQRRDQPGQHLARFVVREPQLGEVDLAELTTALQAVDRQDRFAARQQDHVEPGREVLQEQRQRSDHIVVIHEVEVIDDEDARRVGSRVEVVQQLMDDIGQGAGTTEQGAGRLSASRPQRLERGDHAGPEPAPVPIGLVQGQPGRGHGRLGCPVRDQHGLPDPCRRDDQGEGSAHRLVQEPQQTRATHVMLRHHRRAELRAEQRRCQDDEPGCAVAGSILRHLASSRSP